MVNHLSLPHPRAWFSAFICAESATDPLNVGSVEVFTYKFSTAKIPYSSPYSIHDSTLKRYTLLIGKLD